MKEGEEKLLKGWGWILREALLAEKKEMWKRGCGG
jgi:hypothetical protein